MILIIALLMACGVLGFPVYRDIKKHGRDNILAHTLRDISSIRPVSIGFEFAESMVNQTTKTLQFGGIIAIFLFAGWFLWHIWRAISE